MTGRQRPVDWPKARGVIPPPVRVNQPVDLERIERAVLEILLAIGEDPARDGIKDTPRRVARALAEQFSGLWQSPADVLTTVFDADHDEMVLVSDRLTGVYYTVPARRQVTQDDAAQ